jgi:hypothetical protein
MKANAGSNLPGRTVTDADLLVATAIHPQVELGIPPDTQCSRALIPGGYLWWVPHHNAGFKCRMRNVHYRTHIAG